MFKELYGEFKFNTTTDKILSAFKGLYFIFTVPYLIFAGMLERRYALKGTAQSKEKVSPIEKALLHFSAIVLSIFLWVVICQAIQDLLS